MKSTPSSCFLGLAAVAGLAAAQSELESIPPATFALPVAANNTMLGVAFDQANGDTLSIEPGQLFGTEITQAEPFVAIDGRNSSDMAEMADNGDSLLLVMIDPDAPTPEGPTASAILHWLAPNMVATTAAQDFGVLQGQSVLANSTPNLVPYAPPGPPATSSAHRYLLYLFEQPGGEAFEVPAEFASFNAENRRNFDLAAFMEAAQLEAPIAANFMYVSGQEAVPANFQGEAFGEFPGGNGNAIGLVGNQGEAGAGVGNGIVPGNGTVAGNSTGVAPAPGVAPINGGYTTGQGVMNADGSCLCSVTCPAGSLSEVVVESV